MLPSRGGDVHDFGEFVHARLRLLLSAERVAGEEGIRARSGRTTAGGGDGGAVEAALRGDHGGESRRSGRWRVTAFRRDCAGGARRAAGGESGSPDPGFLRGYGRGGACARRGAAGLQPQYGDGAPLVPASAPASELS